MIRVAYDPFVFLYQRRGGISRSFVELALRGQEMELFAPRILTAVFINAMLREHRQRLRVEGWSPRGRFGGGIERWRFHVGRLMLPWLWARYALMTPADILHETLQVPPASRRFPGPWVTTIMDLIPEHTADDTKPRSRALRWREDSIRHATAVIVPSDSTARDLSRRWPEVSGRIRKIHLGCELPLRRTCRRPLSAVEPNYLLWVGTRESYKNFPGFVAALARLDRWADTHGLVFFGGSGLTATERSMLTKAGWGRAVHYLEGDDDLLADAYAGARALVYPSRMEGFGLPPLEAMSFGCPVICGNASSLPEVAGEAAIQVDPDHAEEMASAIDTLLGDPGQRERRIRLGIEQARRFSWARCAREHADLYRELVERSRGERIAGNPNPRHESGRKTV